jgi:Glycogen recognition site of AMP-activated protein kinase
VRGALLLGAFVMTAPAALPAQDVSVLVGGVSARYADSVSGSAGVVDGRLHVTRGATTGTFDASLAKFASGEWATQLGLQGLSAWTLTSATALGVAFGGSVNALQGGIWSSTIAAGPFYACSAGPFTLSLAAAMGGARSVDSSHLLLGTLTAGARYDRGPWRVETAVTGNGADTLRFLDWTGGLTWRRQSLVLAALGGVRAGDLRGDPWGDIRLEATLNAALRLEAAVGTYPRDVTGFTGGRYATLGFRVGLARDRAGLRTRPAVLIEPLRGGRVRVTVALADAKSAAIAGDWNDWSPAPMSRTRTGRWTTVIQVLPGVHRYAILVDGTRWTVPPGAPHASDDFGGEAALLVVPEA